MNSLRRNLLCLCMAASCLAALTLASPAQAEPYDFDYHSGPTSMVIGVNQFQQFHAELVNTGENEDTYTLTVEIDQPENWTFGVCYGGSCYPPGQTEFQIPSHFTMAPGEVMEIELDITSLTDEGSATYTATFVSNNDPTKTRTTVYTVYTPTEARALELAYGDTVLEGDINEFIQHHIVLYNAGTEDDTYHLTMTRDLPDNWTASFCYGGSCYPPTQGEGDIPDGPGVIASGEAVPIDIDFTTLADEGTGSVTVSLVSNTDGSISDSVTLTVTTEEFVDEPYDFFFRQGPTSMVIMVNQFQQFHSTLVNTGTSADSYTMRVTRDQPENWSFSVCYGGTCYPPTQNEFIIPSTGTVEPGGEIEFDFDVTSVVDEGAGIYNVTIFSDNDNSVTGTWTYTAFTPTEDYALLLVSHSPNVIGTTVNNFVQSHLVLYNAGTEDDTYHLTMSRDMPANWTASFCYFGTCYPPNVDEGDIPADASVIASGEAVEIDIDITTLIDEGTGLITINLVSNTDGLVHATYAFRVTTGSVVGVEDVPASMLLSNLQVAPNPFNPKTTINFNIGGDIAAPVMIDVFDITGRKVRSLQAGTLAPGSQRIAWDGMTDRGNQAATGVYLARVRVGNQQQSIKMSLVK